MRRVRDAISLLWTRRWGWVVFAVLAGCVVAGASVGRAKTKPDTGWYIASDVILGIFVALFAAALIDLAQEFHSIYDIQLIQKQFRDFFGLDEEGDNAAIVLPAYPTPVKVIWGNNYELWKNEAAAMPDSPSGKDDVEVAVHADVVAAAHIISAFEAVQLRYPKIIWDDEALQALSDSKSPYRSFIVIGLTSNEVVHKINKDTGLGRCFKIEFGSSKSAHRTDIWTIRLATRPQGSIDTDPANWKPYENEGEQLDYGLISKIRIGDSSSRKTVFLIGGVTEKGTELLARHIREHWQDIRKWSDNTVRQAIEDREYTAVVKMPLASEPDTVQFEDVRVVGV